MNPLVAEYRALPPSSDHLGDAGPNDRKRQVLIELAEQANDPEVSQLLLDVLRDPLEFDLARAEAIKVVGVYVRDDNPLAAQLWAELDRLAESDEVETLQGWAGGYVDDRRARDEE